MKTDRKRLPPGLISRIVIVVSVVVIVESLFLMGAMN